MRGKIKLVSFVLFAVLMLGFASMVNAQTPSYVVSSNPNEVVHYGVTEVMGRVQLAANNTGTTVGSSITLTYQGQVIKNASSTPTAVGTVGTAEPDGEDPKGIRVQGAGVFAASGMTFTSVSSTGTGGQVIISIPAALAATGDPNVDFFTIDGVRVDVSTKALATDVQASISSSPATANTFNQSIVRVATVNESLVVTTTVGAESICTTPTAPTGPSLTIKEGSAAVFVQYVASTGANGAAVPPDVREAFGAVNNTRINIVISPALPTGVTITWPDTIDSDVLTNLGDGGQLSLISQTASGALYDYTTSLQAVSDANIETFVIDGTSGLVVDIDPDTAVPGGSSVQVQLYPADSATATAVPRFNHPLIPDAPGDGLVQVSKCTTNLLFTFLTNATGVGFDSGMAIANASLDPYGTAPQHGPITIYFYGTGAPTPLTTADVPGGSVWAASLSTIAPGFQGYAIAVAQFQYGHGYAFITGKYNSGSVYDVAEGYMALVIPDPTFVGARNPSPPPQNNLLLPPSSGEQLGQ